MCSLETKMLIARDFKLLLKCSNPGGSSWISHNIVRNIILESLYGYTHVEPPKNYDGIKLPPEDKRKLPIIDKIPPLLPNKKHLKMFKSLHLLRGPEIIHNELIYKQYGVVALQGSRMKHCHFEMTRLTVNRGLDLKRMFAVWRVDPPWQPISKKSHGKRMGGGKSSIDHYATPVKCGRVIIEVGGHCEFEEVYSFLKVVSNNLPFKARAISQKDMENYKKAEEEWKQRNVNPWTPEYVILNNMGGCHSWISPYDKRWFWKYI